MIAKHVNCKVFFHKMNAIRVKFLGNNTRVPPDDAPQIVTINQNWLYIKHWYDMYGKGSIYWEIPDIILFDEISPEEYASKLAAHNFEVVGFSIFSWNEVYQFSVAKLLKEKCPKTLIIFGGPHLTAHKPDDSFVTNSDFFQRHPYIDYVVYGDGERPFQQIVDYTFFNQGDKKDFVNIVENSSGERIIYPHELLADAAYWESNPYIPNKDFIQLTSESLRDLGYGKDKQKWVIEFARGCMYKCSYCDWSQNLSKKVKRRTASWKDTIDFWAGMDVMLREADANFGMWKEDMLMFEYALSKYETNKNFVFCIGNTPKLNSDIQQYVMIKSFQTYGDHPGLNSKMSIQDTHVEVLDAAKRPALPWQEVKISIKNIRKQIPDISVTGEIIVGLPNQTLDHMVENLSEFFILNDGLPNRERKRPINRLCFLPNAPLADETYRKEWGLEFRSEYMFVDSFNKPYLEVDDLDELFKTFKDNKFFFSMPMIYKTSTMSRIDIVSCYLLQGELNRQRNRLTKLLKIEGEERFKAEVFNKFKPIALEKATEFLRLDLEDKYGVSFGGQIFGNRLYPYPLL